MKIAEFEIEVERKEIKNIHLAVYPPDGKVHISVPESMKDDDISMFLYSKLSWIRQKHESVLTQERQTSRYFVTGESHFLLGRRFLLKVLPTNEKPHIERKMKYLEMYVRRDSTIERKQSLMDEFYRKELKAVLSPMVEKWADKMEEDLSSFTWTILLMQKQWGSCMTQKRQIQFNLMLARVPLRCIEYIVVHELTHLRVHQHNKDFALLLDKYMPDWTLRKKELDDFIALPFKQV